MKVSIRIHRQQIRHFLIFLEEGFYARTHSGTTLQTFLIKDLSIASAYLENRIQTLFVNHKPVDSPSLVHLSDTDTVALSAAMPGLLGATMRKGGIYSAMRDSISHAQEQTVFHDNQQIWVKVKCFNLIAKELGTQLLHQGIWIPGLNFHRFLKSNADILRQAGITVNHKSVHLSSLTDGETPEDHLKLKLI